MTNDIQLGFDDLGTPLSEVTFVVVDLETSGSSGLHAITEIGAVKVRGGEVLGEFSTLVNPHVVIPAQIVLLTGITQAMVATAPDIEAVFPSFLEFVGSNPSTVLVAHNAKFDVGHLRAVAKALDYPMPPVQVLDTVSLSRKAFPKPEVANHKLATLAAFVGSPTTPIHRALDDARATVDVLHACLERLAPLGLMYWEDLATINDPVPFARRRKVELARAVPARAGVYRFVARDGEVLYVGSSINMARRVRSYFTAGEQRSRMGEMVDLTAEITTTATPTYLEARVRELREIDSLQPPYNKKSKKQHRAYWLRLSPTPGDLRLTCTKTMTVAGMPAVIGPFHSISTANKAREYLTDFAGGGLNPGAASTPEEGYRFLRDMCDGDLSRLTNFALTQMQDLARAQRYESAAMKRDRYLHIRSALRRKERCLPLLKAGRIIAATRHDYSREDPGTAHGGAAHVSAYEVALIDHGILTATYSCQTLAEMWDAVDLLRLYPPRECPTSVGEGATLEEVELLASWLWHDDTRIFDVDHPQALTMPIAGAHSAELPGENSAL